MPCHEHIDARLPFPSFAGHAAGPHVSSMCTGQVHPADRSRAWVDAVARFAGFSADHEARAYAERKVAFEPLKDGFAGHIDYIAVAKWRLSKVAASGHSLTFDLVAGRDTPTRLLVVPQYKGASPLVQDGKEIRLGAGELAVIPVHKPLRIVNERHAEHYLLWCPESGPRQGTDLNSMRHLAGHSGMQRLLLSFVQSLLADPVLCAPQREDFLSQTLAGILEQSLQDRDAQKQPELLSRLSREQIIRHIENDLHDPELSPETVAQALRCSKRTLHRAFDSQDSGESLNRYVWRRRVERCAAELRPATSAGRRPTVTQVAYSFGFSSCAHFSRLFKRHIGMTPLHYRQSQ